jgi:hypothetical protein
VKRAIKASPGGGAHQKLIEEADRGRKKVASSNLSDCPERDENSFSKQFQFLVRLPSL